MRSLAEFARKRIRHLKKLLKEYGSIQDSDTLHAIRVDIKKIKATLHAMAHSRKKFKAHQTFLPFRDIFRKAGAIRDPEVLAQLLLKYDIKGVSGGFLPDKTKAVATFLEDLPVFLQHVDKHKDKIIETAGKTSKKGFRKYVATKMKEVKDGIYPRVLKKNLHKVRKSAKDVIYLSTLDNSIGKKNRKFLDELETAVGDWHDKQTLLQLAGLRSDGKQTLRSLSDADAKSIGQMAGTYFGK